VAPGAEPAREPRTAPLRTPAPPALSLPALPPRAAPPAPPRPAPLPVADAALGDRWAGLVRQLTDAGLAGLVRELAAQGGLRAIDDATAPPTWRLLVERETLRTPALADKLAAAIAPVLGQPVRFELEPGAPEDSPARRDAAERQRVQAAAEALIRDDPVVLELLKQYKSARIVPGSIKPV
jgi:DNA polymerase-3 subunit gamma/tau